MQPPSGFVTPLESSALGGALWNGIRSRRSIRVYRDDRVPLELVERILIISGSAPSAHNRQPWRWVVVATPSARRNLADAMAVDFARDLLRDGMDDAAIETTVARSRQRIGGAPMLVIPCLSMEDMDSYPDPERQHHEWLMAVQSVALATQNLMLAAHDAGLGSCWLCAPLFCAPVVRRALELPGDWQPQALITLGYPAAPGRDRPRKALADITLYR